MYCLVLLTSQPWLTMMAEGACTDKEKCRNEYTAQKEFYMIYWGLTEVPRDIPEYAEQVHLSHNSISKLPHKAFFMTIPSKMVWNSPLDRCKELNLQHNQISIITPGAFERLYSLECLYLYNNRMKSLEARTFLTWSPPSTHKLYLQRSKISSLAPNTFQGMEKVYYLYLEFNSISVLPPKVFKGLSGCCRLHLEHNRISSLQYGSFYGLRTVHYVILHHNQISCLRDKVFKHIWLCCQLDLSHNQIAHIETESFTELHKLKHLLLHNNQIVHISCDTFTDLVSLKILTLFNNLLHLSDIASCSRVAVSISALNSSAVSPDVPWACTSECPKLRMKFGWRRSVFPVCLGQNNPLCSSRNTFLGKYAGKNFTPHPKKI